MKRLNTMVFKNYPIIRWIGVFFITALAIIVGTLLHCSYLTYHYRVPIRVNEIMPWWWFVNNTFPEVKGDRDHGDFGRFLKDTWKGFLQQNVIRNPAHNFRWWIGPLQEMYTHITGTVIPISVDWNYYVGSTYGTFRRGGVKYFVHSRLFHLFGMYWYYRIGMDNKTYDYTVKWGKIKEE